MGVGIVVLQSKPFHLVTIGSIIWSLTVIIMGIYWPHLSKLWPYLYVHNEDMVGQRQRGTSQPRPLVGGHVSI